jgi:hypothetical protein
MAKSAEAGAGTGDLRRKTGWVRDPFEVHEMRYLSNGKPTAWVRDGRNETHDPPPSTELPDPLAARNAFLSELIGAQEGSSLAAAISRAQAAKKPSFMNKLRSKMGRSRSAEGI